MVGRQGGLLLDCGLSAAQVLRRFREAGRDPAELGGIVLTHEHADHARGAPALADRLGIPILASPGTLDAVPAGAYERVPLRPGTRHAQGPFTVRLFPVTHDAAQPMGIVLEAEGTRLGLLTDAGEVTPTVVENLHGCHHLLVESNHDPELLRNGPYPVPLKNRIGSRHGHLSNDDCGRLLTRVVSEETRRVVLAHLSRFNNTPELALATNHALFRRAGRAPPEMVAAPPSGPFGPFPL